MFTVSGFFLKNLVISIISTQSEEKLKNVWNVSTGFEDVLEIVLRILCYDAFIQDQCEMVDVAFKNWFIKRQ